MRYSLLGVYPNKDPRPGSSEIGRLDFEFEPEMGPIKLTRRYQKKDPAGGPGEWVTADAGEVRCGDGSRITVKGAKFGRTVKGPYCISDTINIPYDLAKAIAAEAVATVARRSSESVQQSAVPGPARAAPAANGTAPKVPAPSVAGRIVAVAVALLLSVSAAFSAPPDGWPTSIYVDITGTGESTLDGADRELTWSDDFRGGPSYGISSVVDEAYFADAALRVFDQGGGFYAADFVAFGVGGEVLSAYQSFPEPMPAASFDEFRALTSSFISNAAVHEAGYEPGGGAEVPEPGSLAFFLSGLLSFGRRQPRF